MTEKTAATSMTAQEAFDRREVLFERVGKVAVLTFNRPHVRNALNMGMYEALYETCRQVDEDDSLRVLLLKGAGGRAFVAGTDISFFKTFEDPSDVEAYNRRMDRIIGRVEEVRKPVIAACQGFTVGGGAAIALQADIRLATPDFRFGFPIARTLGNCLSPRLYGRLVQLINPSRTKEIIFTARLMEAPEALAAGLVNEIVPSERLDERALQMGAAIAENAPLTILATKESVRRVQQHQDPENSNDQVLMCYLSEDFKEGVSAFLAKRKPIWQGK